jgi:RNA polymerase sigma factor (sigma-70 family)
MSVPDDQEFRSGVEKPPTRCSFCNKVPGDGTPLIEGPFVEGSHRASICGDCVELCSAIIEQQRARGDADEGPIAEATQAMLRETIDRVLDVLSAREREVLKLRYGLADGYTYTLDEVAGMFDITPEKVREIEARAVATLQSGRSQPVP